MKNTILLYDDHCPLCVCYTDFFVKTGFLSPEERKAFSSADADILSRIDIGKGMNEIPFVDMSSGKAVYGIDALLEILNRKLPGIKTIGNINPIKWFLIKLYKFISYNRKVIVAKKCGPGAIDCAPEFSYFYRILFMAVFLFFNTAMLFAVHPLLQKLSFYHLSVTGLQAGHFMLVLINCLLATTLPLRKAIDYLGQVNMLALTCTLLLIPVILLQSFIPSATLGIYLTGLTIFIFREYLRRMDYLGFLSGQKWIISLNLAAISFFILYLFNQPL